mmetsp:Transcript_108694/g.303102  ORF Transcript_108694/g.303102 Transcript_108694/m.303102 type:complete len:220 (-) Transcript_108694:612-1271(-)
MRKIAAATLPLSGLEHAVQGVGRGDNGGSGVLGVRPNVAMRLEQRCLSTSESSCVSFSSFSASAPSLRVTSAMTSWTCGSRATISQCRLLSTPLPTERSQTTATVLPEASLEKSEFSSGRTSRWSSSVWKRAALQPCQSCSPSRMAHHPGRGRLSSTPPAPWLCQPLARTSIAPSTSATRTPKARKPSGLRAAWWSPAAPAAATALPSRKQCCASFSKR